MSSDPWKSVRQRVFPCTAAETIGRTKPPSSVWEENKFRGFPLETPTMPVMYRRSSRCFNEKKNLVQTYKHTLILCDYSKIDISVSVKKFKQLNMGLIRYYSDQSMSIAVKYYTTAWNGRIFFCGLGVASTIAHARPCEIVLTRPPSLHMNLHRHHCHFLQLWFFLL